MKRENTRTQSLIHWQAHTEWNGMDWLADLNEEIKKLGSFHIIFRFTYHSLNVWLSGWNE